MLLIDKTGRSIPLHSAEFVAPRRVLISDDNRAVHEMLEKGGLEISWGEHEEHTAKMNKHYVVSSVADGGSSHALQAGQIIVGWEEAMKSFYVYSDSDQGNIEANSIQKAAKAWGVPTEAEMKDGAYMVVRDEETMEELHFGSLV